MGFLGDAKRGAGERVGHRAVDGGISLSGWAAKKVGIVVLGCTAAFGAVTTVQTVASDRKGPSFRALWLDQAGDNVRSMSDAAGITDPKPKPIITNPYYDPNPKYH